MKYSNRAYQIDPASGRPAENMHWKFRMFWTRTHHDWHVLVLFSQTGSLRIVDENFGKEESSSLYRAAKASGVVGGVE